MKKKGKIEKALKPSQRQSVTEFSTTFGSGPSYEDRVRRRRIISAVLITLGIIALIAVGYFITDTLICITELPVTPTDVIS